MRTSFPEPRSERHRCAFTLLEVLIALTIFFMVAFAVLELVMQGVKTARLLQLRHADAGMLAAELSLTNMLAEGMESGDFGELYPDWSWERDIHEVGTNGLFQVDFIVYEQSGGKPKSPTTMSVLMYRPASVRGARTPGFGGR